MQILIYTLGELQELFQSTWWEESPYIPFSTLRLHSYLNNPAADKNDHVLFLALKQNRMVGFRTLLPDSMQLAKGPIKMAWLSGSWTHPEYRRQGISSALFSKAIEKWQGRLAYSNYAPQSKMLYDQLDYHWHGLKLPGKRYYHRFAMATILPSRLNILRNSAAALRTIDQTANKILDTIRRQNSGLQLPMRMEIVKRLDERDSRFLAPFLDKQFFSRSVREFNWIQSYSWISEQEKFRKEQERYPFTLYTNQFRSFFCRFLNDNQEVEALLMIHIHNGFLSIPYVFMPTNLSAVVSNYLKQMIQKNKISISTLSGSLAFQKPEIGLISKTYPRQFFFGPELSISPGLSLQYGDGDAVFV